MELRKKTGWGRIRIARELGISPNTVGNWLYSKSKGKKYHKAWEREHRVTTTGYKRLVGKKRAYPKNKICELCNKKSKILDYHHYDDNDLSKGLWLCRRRCHTFAEIVDKGLTVKEMIDMGLNYANKKLVAKYKELKNSILKS